MFGQGSNSYSFNLDTIVSVANSLVNNPIFEWVGLLLGVVFIGGAISAIVSRFS